MPRKYLIDGLLPERELSLLAGPSGGSKTTWLFQTIELWRVGAMIHNYASHPCPFVYASIDRSQEAAEETMERVGIDTRTIPLLCGVENDLSSIDAVIAAAAVKCPQARFLIIDGFATLTPGGKTNDYYTVARFCRHVTRLCKKHNITILGIVHAAKTKENEKYLNPRERILGSVAWAGFTETLFFIAPISPDNVTDNLRLLEILPRQAAQERIELQLDGRGRLVPSTRHAEMDQACMSFLDQVPTDGEFSAMEFAAKLKVGRSKIYMILNQLLEAGAIKKTKNNTYLLIVSPFIAN